MKIRRGFVSNSSSTSFTIFGWVHNDDIKGIINKEYFYNNEKFVKRVWSLEKVLTNEDEWDDIDSYDINEYLNDLGFDVETGYEDEPTYVGVHAALSNSKKLSEEQKIDNFVNHLKGIRDKILNSDVFNDKFKNHVKKTDIGICEECYRDG